MYFHQVNQYLFIFFLSQFDCIYKNCILRYHDLFEFFSPFDNIFSIRQSPSIFNVWTLFLCKANQEITISRTWQSRSLCQSASHFFLKRWRLHSLAFFPISEKYLNEEQQKHAAKCSEHRSPLNNKDIISAILSRNCYPSFLLYLLHYLCFEFSKSSVRIVFSWSLWCMTVFPFPASSAPFHCKYPHPSFAAP